MLEFGGEKTYSLPVFARALLNNATELATSYYKTTPIGLFA
jgi:hypothetical protein